MNILFCINAVSQNYNYYYYKGKKQNIDINTDYLATSDVNTSSLYADVNDKKLNVIKIGENLSIQKYRRIVKGIKENSNMKVYPCFRIKENENVTLSDFFYVKIKKESDISILTKYSEKHRCVIINQDANMPLWFILSTTKNSTLNSLQLANLFQESGLFEFAEVDFVIENIINFSTDDFFPHQWNLKNTGQLNFIKGIDINISKAWKISKGENINIAVLDQGIELDHPDLKNNLHHLSYDTETFTFPSIVRGNHGTACAGIIGAENNSIGVTGVAPKSKLMSISNSLKSTYNIRQKLADGINWA